MSMWSSIADQIASETGRPFSVRRQRSVGGGCINSAVLLEGKEGLLFVKLNPNAGAEMFAAELAGLREIIDSRTVRAPTPICCGSVITSYSIHYTKLYEGSTVCRSVSKASIQT